MYSNYPQNIVKCYNKNTKKEQKVENNKEKITIKQTIWYLVIFSIVGLILETIFCYITTGIIESRKGLIWGPFCPVYGVGATILIVLLNRYKDNIIKLFLAGSVIGNIIEYGLSYVLEAMYGMRFWDYSYIDLHLNGRICIKYSIFWGILAIILIKFIKPYIDKIINYIPNNKKLNITIIIFTFIDCIATVWAVKTYENRVVNSYYNIKGKEKNAIIKYVEDTLFSNKKMKKTFPNLRYIDKNGKQHDLKKMIKEN